ncbi:MAG: FAD-binding and (Fe-S)-binding domain-containing protein, partial [Chloroflexota bacterium]|nr:FAD-binding and (Fe-S)-binding domain-containing protein [Chloroflexota bacterium]
MGKLTSKQETWLRERFNGRVRTDLMERKIYSHDVGDVPLMVKPLVGKAIADGVVQPKSEDELVELVKMAAQERLPLVPRGKATSGYGGVLPIKGGLVVDFYRLRQILAVDDKALTVTVEPGIVWELLETELNKQGLALRLYPSSAPSSTVGGWLAQGGFGYGSFEFGAFQENVVSTRVVLPNGEAREFAGEELDLISDAEGITGLISQITLRIRPVEEEVIIGARFNEAKWLVAALKAVVKEKLPFWSVSFINPTMARLKNQMPPKLEHGHPVERDFPTCPEAYVAIFVCPASRAGEVVPALRRILAANGGELCPQGMADHEWGERFGIMKIKRLGPSLVPSEVLVPVENLDRTLDEIESKIQQPLAIEGMILKGDMALLLGFIPHDYRKLGYNMAFALALSVIKIAKKYGGRAYATGLYFAQEADDVLGAERVQRLRQFKQQVDARGIMNPGKVLGNGLLGTVMNLAGAFEPLVRIFGNAAKSPLGERMEGLGKRGVPDDVAWYAHACAQCGYCVDECDQFYGRGWESESPRGKWFFLREYMRGNAKMTQEWVNKFLACTTCEVCNVECPLDLPIEPSWLKMRGQLIHEEGRMTFPPFEIMRASLRKERNIWASYSKDRSAWVPDELQDKIKWRAEIGYFPGCTASYVEPDVAQGTVQLLDAAGVEFTYMGDGEACCGLPMLVSGQWDAWEEIMRHNINGMKERGVETVVTSCPACWLSWTHYYPEWAEKLGIEYGIESKHYTEILAERIESGDLEFTHEVSIKKATWHDSCHMGRAGGSGGIYEP